MKTPMRALQRNKSILAFSFVLFFCVSLNANALSAPVITSPATAGGAVGTAFSYQTTATNSPTSYKVTGLPAGLTVNSKTGLIHGTPTTAGTSKVTLSATNRRGTGSATLAISIAAAAPVITSALSATGQVGSAFSYQITAKNSPTSYGAASLPTGLTISSATGLISGTPTAAGAASVTLSAANSGGTANAALALSVSVPAPVITSATTAAGKVGSAFSYQISATNSPTSYGATSLPAGLTVNGATGLISGTPTAAGTASVTLSATNSGGTANATLALTINVPAPEITSAATATATAGTTFSFQITATNSPTSYGATSLPGGLTVNSATGLISGTPTATGTASVILSATNSGGAANATLALTVNASGAAVASVSPSSLSFGNEPVALPSSSLVVTLTNTGNATLNITSTSLTGSDPADFSEVSTCGSSLAAGSNCTIAILFTPSASGSRSASLAFADNASGSPQSVSLSGTGTHDVMLSWSDTGSGILGYNVYRGTTSGGESSTPLNSTPVASATFTDESVQAGQTYYYYVTAVSSTGDTQSPVSNEASATVP